MVANVGTIEHVSSTQQVAALIAALAALDTTGSDADRIDEITALEQLKTAISARPARLTDAFAGSHRAELIQTGMKPVDARRCVCAQIALARRDSPHQGHGHVGLLHRAATTAHTNPDDHRSKGQVMVDELIKRVLTPGSGEPEQPAVELHLVMTDRALADQDSEPAHLVGYGPVPAGIARDLLTADQRTRVWMRRRFTDPPPNPPTSAPWKTRPGAPDPASRRNLPAGTTDRDPLARPEVQPAGRPEQPAEPVSQPCQLMQARVVWGRSLSGLTPCPTGAAGGKIATAASKALVHEVPEATTHRTHRRK